jgi:hypothetical protein
MENKPTGPITFKSSDEDKKKLSESIRNFIVRLGGGTKEQKLEHQDGLIKRMVMRALAGLNRQNREE